MLRVLSQNEEDRLRQTLSDRRARVLAALPWPKIHRQGVDVSLVFSWSASNETAWSVEGADYWRTAQAETPTDLRAALDAEKLNGLQISADALLELFSAFEILGVPLQHVSTPSIPFSGEQWKVCAPLDYQSLFSRISQSATLGAYLVFARVDGHPCVRHVFSNSAAHASATARKAWKKEKAINIDFFATFSRVDLPFAAERFHNAQTGYNPDLLWPPTSQDEYDLHQAELCAWSLEILSQKEQQKTREG